MDCSLDPLSMNDNVIPASYANVLMADSIPTIDRNESIPMNICHNTISPDMTSVLLIGIHYDRE